MHKTRDQYSFGHDVVGSFTSRKKLKLFRVALFVDLINIVINRFKMHFIQPAKSKFII